ncbi:MAG: UDP-N-acetylmuramoyl-tripeptide--D-alanyl-D-alanine ligase [Planctomycetota bacterium]|nr:MAG: UDP-N-acetylmuramoyl-tripeptide--D-alanyl-D-alanine ligase [Planctomycetota bacterium]
MLGLTVAEAARRLGAGLRGDGGRKIARVITDSRGLGPGDLFVALPGARTDGHRFLAEAAAAGAAAALVQPDRGERPPDLPVIVVEDTLAALGELARFHLGRLGCPVFGITGSVGKTSAKDFLAQLLGGPAAGVHAAPASYNSEVGLPLAVLAAPLGSRFLVLEYGVNAPGEMARLLAVARPRHAWITALAPVHLEGMGDFETVVAEKTRLAAAVGEGGWVWSTPEVFAVAARFYRAWPARSRLAGLDGEDGGRVLDPRPGAFRVELPGLGPLRLPVVARHEAELAAVAAAIALDLGVPAEELRARLQDLRRPPGRLAVHEFGPIEVLDDAYNSSPAALEAALDVVRAWPRRRRRLAVLGTMHELGADSEELHRSAGASAGRCCDAVLGIGPGGEWIAEGARALGCRRVETAADPAAAERLLPELLGDDTLVLLKASRAVGLDRLVPVLARLAAELGPPREEGA